MSRQCVQPPEQIDLFDAGRAWPEGFDYRESIVSPEDERTLIERFHQLPFKPFEFHGFVGNRRVVSFGWRYDYTEAALQPSGDVPPFLLPLREQAAAFANISAQELQQILINEYGPGAGIGWHRDRPMFEDVIAISLGATCTLRLRRKRGNAWERATQQLRPRSAYLLRGPARREWQHSIPPVAHLRYSVTFRNFAADHTKQDGEVVL